MKIIPGNLHDLLITADISRQTKVAYWLYTKSITIRIDNNVHNPTESSMLNYYADKGKKYFTAPKNFTPASVSLSKKKIMDILNIYLLCKKPSCL